MATQKEMNKDILAAARDNNIYLLQECINKGEKVNCQDVNYNCQSPLHWAAWNGSTSAAAVLLDSGASLDVLTCLGEQPLHTAAMYGSTKVVELLLEKGASPHVVNIEGWTPLHHAAGKGYRDVADLLINKGALLSVENKKRWTPLHCAAGYGRTEVVELLLKKGASLSVVTENAWTPLHIAAMYGRTNEVSLLLGNGALPDVTDNEGCTPLYYASYECRTEVVELLLIAQASPFVENKKGKTPYDVARGKTKDLLQKYVNTNDMPATDEIVARIPMMDTSDQGTFISYENFVYLGGDCNVGKSTLASNLIGEEISQHWKSTDGLTIYFGRNGIDLKSKEMVPLKQATIQEDIKQEIRKGTYKIEIVPSDLAGLGAHMSFDMTHELFMRHKGTFVLMCNGTIDFSVPLKEYEQEVTTESIFQHWVNSILSCCADDGDILPIIMFCATHSDLYNKEDRKDRKKKLIHDLREIFKNHERQHRIIYDDIFFINGLDNSDPEINKLKSKLVEVACNQKSWGKSMPMAWVPLDLQMSELRLHNMNIITKEELITLNQRNKDPALTVEQIKYFLNFQHSLGKIVYFDQQGLDQFIIVQPQSLVNILRSFITAENFWPEEKELKGIICTLTKTGKIAKQDLLKLWSQKKFHQYMPNDEFKEFIIQVLVHLYILVEPKHYRQEQGSRVQSYLVPCIFTDFYVKSAERIICLSYTFLKSSIPAALFSKLIGAATNVWPLQEKLGGICLYHQGAILCIDESNELHLLVEDDKVLAYLLNKTTKRFIPPNIASTVQGYLTLTMTKVLESLSTSEVSKAFEIKVGEWCTSGGGCYISVPKVKEGGKWICKNNKNHDTKFPLYWIFDKNQWKCDQNCSGFDEKDLALHPEDKHLFRLATLIPPAKCFSLASRLGVSCITWDSILCKHMSSSTVTMFLALCEWKHLKYEHMSKPSFKELSEALAEDNHSHFLCWVFMEDVTVYDIANVALHETPEDDVLQDLSKEVGNCVVHLGVELGLSMGIIESVQFMYPKIMFQQTFHVMKEWKLSSKVNTILMLMKAFQSVDRRGLSFLRTKYRV